jgi:hypothetical protein
MEHNTQDRIDIENAEFGDWVYFVRDYDTGSVIIPEGMGAMIRNELSPDCEWITAGHHTVDIDFGGKYCEIEAPYDVLAMQ